MKKRMIKKFPQIRAFEGCKVTKLKALMNAGVVTGLLSNPMDVMKTRMMNTHVKYTGILDCFISTARNEGLQGFYKGCATTIARQCAYTVGTFVAMEQIKKAFATMDAKSQNK